MAAAGSRLMVDDRQALWLARCLGNSTTSPLSPDDLSALLAVTEVVSAEAGEVLFARHATDNDVYIVERGRVALTRARPGSNGAEDRVLLIMNPGDVFGDVPLFLDRTAPVDAVALDDVQLLRLAGPDLLALVTTRPRLAQRWMVSLASRLADAQDRLEELLSGPLDVQLASLLGHTADDDGRVTASQEMLARLLGARRPSIARSLANLERRGLIEKGYRAVQVVDRQGLASLAAP